MPRSIRSARWKACTSASSATSAVNGDAWNERMMTYALGRPVGFSDRETVESFVTTLKTNDYKIQSLIQAIVASEFFQTK